jgi:HlyD family secretion protein
MVLAANKTRATWIGVALVAAVAGFLYYRSRSDAPPAVRWETSKVERGAIVAKVTATGTLSALVTVQVGSQVSGRLKEILVDFNSNVTKDQVIAKIDPQLFEAALAQARANHLAARANLTRAEVQAVEADRQYQRSKALGERKLIASAEIETAQANRDSMRAQVEAAKGAVAQAQASLQQAEVNLTYTTIRSPISGVVISRSVDVGQTVAASLQAPTLFVIAEDLRKMQVNTSVAEADIGKLRAGMEATFVVDAHPNKRFKGAVRQIRNAPQTLQNVVTYDAVIDVDNPELELRPGMTANVTFVYAKVDDAIRVPSSALRFRPSPEQLARAGVPVRGPGVGAGGGGGGGRRQAEESPGTRTVWILDGLIPRPVSIKTGVSDGSVTEVVEGELEEGMQLIVGAGSGGDRPRQQQQKSPFRGL